MLQAIIHEAVAGTSHFEDFHENVVGWSGLLYHCDNVRLTHKLAKIDTATPADMRAWRGNRGVRARDRHGRACLRDRRRSGRAALAELCREDENEDKPHSSKELRECYRQVPSGSAGSGAILCPARCVTAAS